MHLYCREYVQDRWQTSSLHTAHTHTHTRANLSHVNRTHTLGCNTPYLSLRDPMFRQLHHGEVPPADCPLNFVESNTDRAFGAFSHDHTLPLAPKPLRFCPERPPKHPTLPHSQPSFYHGEGHWAVVTSHTELASPVAGALSHRAVARCIMPSWRKRLGDICSIGVQKCCQSEGASDRVKQQNVERALATDWPGVYLDCHLAHCPVVCASDPCRRIHARSRLRASTDLWMPPQIWGCHCAYRT